MKWNAIKWVLLTWPTVRPSKLRRWCTKQRKADCRAVQGDKAVHGLRRPGVLKGFCKALLKGRWGGIAGYLVRLCTIFWLADGEGGVSGVSIVIRFLAARDSVFIVLHYFLLGVRRVRGAHMQNNSGNLHQTLLLLPGYFQFSSVAQSCLSLCNPMDLSTPGFPVHHQLAQTLVHWVSDAIQPSHPLSSLLLLPSIFLSIRVFANESALCIQ